MKIKITICHAFGQEFVGLTPDSEHEVVQPPVGHDEYRGHWVMGVTEPVLVLNNEHIVLN